MSRACMLKALMIVLVVFLQILMGSAEDGSVHCETVVRNWSQSSSDSSTEEDKLALKDLLFFLHVPRTGGRTYFHCFLRKLYTSNQECPRSYDKLRFNPSKTKCRLMVTHDDYSLLSKLPKEQTSVVTILRNPIDRVFSTYEFAVEVAARFLVHPNLTSVAKMTTRLRPKSRGVSTLDIWPWKYLVPWMREDLFARRDARKLKSVKIKKSGDPYNMEEIVMPLIAFINDPISHDIVHNGATFQVAGLTNNSYLDEAHSVRQCIRKHPSLGRYVLEVAKKRLDNMLYVGLTEEHRKSATMFANMVGAQVLSQSESSSVIQTTTNRSEPSTSKSSTSPESSARSAIGAEASENPSTKDINETNGTMTVEKLMEAYETCITSLRKAQSSRRTMSLKKVVPAKFSKEARKLVPEAVLQQILTLNSLDVELYKHAQLIFNQQHKHLDQSFDSMKTGDQIMPSLEMESRIQGILAALSSWKLVLVPVASILTIAAIYFIITASRRTSKLKV